MKIKKETLLQLIKEERQRNLLLECVRATPNYKTLVETLGPEKAEEALREAFDGTPFDFDWLPGTSAFKIRKAIEDLGDDPAPEAGGASPASDILHKAAALVKASPNIDLSVGALDSDITPNEERALAIWDAATDDDPATSPLTATADAASFNQDNAPADRLKNGLFKCLRTLFGGRSGITEEKLRELTRLIIQRLIPAAPVVTPQRLVNMTPDQLRAAAASGMKQLPPADPLNVPGALAVSGRPGGAFRHGDVIDVMPLEETIDRLVREELAKILKG